MFVVTTLRAGRAHFYAERPQYNRIFLQATPIGVIIAQVLSLRFRICANST
jgi:hypothetical protein